MKTLSERVKRLEDEVEKLGVDCFKQAAAHAYDALQPNWGKIDAISDRLVRVEHIAEETRADVSVLNRQMTVATVRFDHIDTAIARMDGRIDELSNRVDTLTCRVDTLTVEVETLGGHVEVLTGRVDGLTTRVDTLTNRVDTLTGQVSVLTGRVDGLTDQVGALTGRVDDLTTRVDALSDQMTTMTVRVDGMADHIRRMTDMNKTMFDSVLTRLEDVYTQIRMRNLADRPAPRRVEDAEDGGAEASA